MKLAIITDTHFGCRKNSAFFMQEQNNFYLNKFFPYLIENDIDTILHLGDFFDNRKTVNFEALRHSRKCFIEPIIDCNLTLHMLVGNHDSYYKSNGELTSTKLLYGDMPNINVYDSMTELMFGDKRFLMVPWIFPIQMEETVARLQLNTVDVCCGHFEMMGVVFQGNSISRKGIDTDTFSHFPNVFSGHFHKKSQYYVGCPYQMSWADYDDKKRIIVYDTDTGKPEDVYLADDIFYKIEYPLAADIDLSSFKNRIVRVIVRRKDNVEDFNTFIKHLEEVEPQEIDIKEEYLYIDIINEDELDDETDTLGVLLSSIDSINDLQDGDKIVTKEIIKQLYKKAGEI